MTKILSILKSAVFILVGLSITGCAPAIRNYVNKKYPPVSSMAKSTEAVKQSIEQLQTLPQVDLGAKISKELLDSTFHMFFDSLLAKNNTLGIQGLDKIDVIRVPIFSLGKQELLISSTLKFTLKNNKYLKDIQIAFSGRVAPSISADTLFLRPSFQSVRIEQLHLRKCLFLGKVAKEAVNAICANFMDNINGQIRDINVKINYPPIPEATVSSILGNDPNITVKNDFIFKLKRQILKPVILINQQNFLILSAINEAQDNTTVSNIALAPDYSSSMPQPNYLIDKSNNLVSVGKVQLAAVEKTEVGNRAVKQPIDDFNQVYNYLDSAFKSSWDVNLDTINYKDSVGSAVHLSYGAINRITDELFRDVKFNLQYNVNISQTFNEQDISLGEIQKPNCNNITFDCQLNNCSNVLSDCGSCRWYDVPCHVRYATCQALNGVKYTACQASNAAKLTWCAGELVARRTLCYTEIAAIFLYDNLVKPVGKFGGYATANGTITGEINQTTPDGINSLGLIGRIQTDINGEVGIHFTPSGLLGLMICNLPTAAKFNLDHIHVSKPDFNLHADFSRLNNAANQPYLKVSMSKLTLPIQLQEPFVLEILKNPQLILNCGTGILAGLSYLALKDSENFERFLDLSLKGSYKFDIQRDFDINLPPIPLEILQYQTTLNPAWGSKSLIYNNLVK
jgi:hypothetical protein